LIFFRPPLTSEVTAPPDPERLRPFLRPRRCLNLQPQHPTHLQEHLRQSKTSQNDIRQTKAKTTDEAKSQFQLPALDGAGLFVADAAVVGAAPAGWRLSWKQIRFNIAVKTYESGLIFITSIKASNDAWSSACVSEGAAAAAAAGGSASPFILILIFLTNSSSLSLFGSCPIANYNET
jgi:hypothetical protein